MNKYLSTKDVADTFSVSISAVRNWILRKQMPQPDIKQKRFVRWKLETIQPFLENPVKWRQENSH